jgi:hypothetical protein
VSDIYTVEVYSLKTLDLKWPIREADIEWLNQSASKALVFIAGSAFANVSVFGKPTHEGNANRRKAPNRDPGFEGTSRSSNS